MTAQNDLQAIIALAEADPLVLAIGTEGSLNDTALTQDAWADLDVSVFVADPASFDGRAYVELLGTPVIVQHLLNEALFGPSSALWDTYLVRYAGIRRIDWKFAPVADIKAYLAADSLNTIVWRAEDGLVTPRTTSAASHAVVLPTQTEFDACVNELLWCAGNVAKGLARQQLIYANEQLNQVVRPELLRLLSWQVAAQQAAFDAGASYKHLTEALAPEQQTMLAATYAQNALAETQASLLMVLQLAEMTVQVVANQLSLPVPPELGSALAQLRGWLK